MSLFLFFFRFMGLLLLSHVIKDDNIDNGKSYCRLLGNIQKYSIKFSRVVLEICERTDRHTDPVITIFRTALGDEVITSVHRCQCRPF